ncbi:MAG: hypothetical protein AABX80_01420, partial [Nanoarchaeota archaeon]
MNFLKRLFKRKIKGEEFNELIFQLKDMKLVRDLNKYALTKHASTKQELRDPSLPFAYLDVKKKPGYGVEFNLEIYKK